MKQGFWAGVYGTIDAMWQAGDWWIYGVMGLLVAGLCGWAVWAWKTFRREAGL